MKYRPDIDGLRALAVVPVVLYHVGFGTPGGFAGVDVFFVISGYLITMIVIEELRRGDFSISRFYERRARRLFPALFAMLLVTTIVARFWLLPADLVNYAKSAVSTLFFVSNIFFYTDIGYFNESVRLKPLLHTWSLGVEEQFYLVAPLALVMLWKFFPAWSRGLLIIVAVLGSFSLGVWLAGHPAGFYLPFSRAWELGVGMLLAVWGVHLRHKATANLLGFLGLALLIGTFALASPATPWPGLAALAPCLGAAAIIVSGSQPGSLVAKALAFRGVVGLGRISYSLYLWHWPVIVFAGYGRFGSFTISEKMFLVLFSLLLAALSWKWIEEPIRQRRSLVARQSVVFGSVFSISVLCAISGALIMLEGLPHRVPSALAEQWQQPSFNDPDRGCHNVTLSRSNTEEFCVRGAEDVRPTFVLVGDSHAHALSPGIFAAAERIGAAGWQFTGPGFIPTPGRERIGSVMRRASPDHRVEALRQFLQDQPDVGWVIVTGWWHRYATGLSYREERAIWRDAECLSSSLSDCMASSLKRSLVRLAKEFEDRNFIFLDDVPVGWNLHPQAHFRAAFRGMNSQAPVLPSEIANSQYESYAPILKSVADSLPNVVYHPAIFRSLCSESGCSAVGENGRLLFRDGDHLSPYGAGLLVNELEQVLKPLDDVESARTGM